MKRMLLLLVLWSGLASAQTVTEDGLRTKARAYTGFQKFSLLGAPRCNPDPPASGACQPTSTCFSHLPAQIWYCLNGTWTVFGQGVATVTLAVAAEDTEILFTDVDAPRGASAATYNKVSGETKLKILNGVRNAAFYATSGTGTSGAPWKSFQGVVASDTTIRFPKGYYDLETTAISIGSGVNNVVIEGDGPETVIRAGNGLSGGMIGGAVGIEGSQVTIRNLTIDGQSNLKTLSSAAIRVNDAPGLVIENVVFVDIAGSAIFIRPEAVLDNAIIRNNRILKVNAGMFAAEWMEGDGRTNPASSSGHGYGIIAYNLKHSVIENNDVHGTELVGIYLSFVNGPGSADCTGNRISGNKIYDTENGIRFFCDNVTVQGNLVDTSLRDGIRVSGDHAVVSGNTVRNTTHNGIAAYDDGNEDYVLDGLVVTGNYFWDVLGSAGIYVYSDGGYTTTRQTTTAFVISGNVIYNGASAGILVQPNAIGGLVTGNVVYSTPTGFSNRPVTGKTGVGTVTTTGAAVVGVGTSFDTEITPGEGSITVSGQLRNVSAVTNATNLTVTSAFSPDLSGQTYTISSTAPPTVVSDIAVYGNFYSDTTVSEAFGTHSLWDYYSTDGVSGVPFRVLGQSHIRVTDGVGLTIERNADFPAMSWKNTDADPQEFRLQINSSEQFEVSDTTAGITPLKVSPTTGQVIVTTAASVPALAVSKTAGSGAAVSVTRTGADSPAIDLTDSFDTAQTWRLAIDASENFQVFDVTGANATMTLKKASAELDLDGPGASLIVSTTSGSGTVPFVRYRDLDGTAGSWTMEADDTSVRMRDTTGTPTTRAETTRSTGRTTFTPGVVVGGDSIDEFIGSGLTLSGNTVQRSALSGAIEASSGSNATTPGKIDALDASAFCADAGSTDAYACSLSPAITAYVTGTHYRFKANTANTGAATINFNSVGAKAIKKFTSVSPGADLADSDIRAGQWVEVVYDGTNMQMQSTMGGAGDITDVGTCTSGNCSTITINPGTTPVAAITLDQAAAAAGLTRDSHWFQWNATRNEDPGAHTRKFFVQTNYTDGFGTEAWWTLKTQEDSGSIFNVFRINDTGAISTGHIFTSSIGFQGTVSMAGGNFTTAASGSTGFVHTSSPTGGTYPGCGGNCWWAFGLNSGTGGVGLFALGTAVAPNTTNWFEVGLGGYVRARAGDTVMHTITPDDLAATLTNKTATALNNSIIADRIECGSSVTCLFDAAAVPSYGKRPVVAADGSTITFTHDFSLTMYGDASDGSVTFDGSTAVAGASLLANASCIGSGNPWGCCTGGTNVCPTNTYLLDRDVYYSGATINSNVTVIVGGKRVFVTGTLTNNGTLTSTTANYTGYTGISNGSCFGQAATGVTGGGGGVHYVGVTTGSGSLGGNGQTGNTGAGTGTGTNGATNTGEGGAGGTGGIGGNNATAAKTGGALTAFKIRYPSQLHHRSNNAFNGAGTGGGGGTSGQGAGADNGGGGGGAAASGNPMQLFVRYFGGSGTISVAGCIGGAGAQGSGGTASGGGGGAGGGGASFYTITDSDTISCTVTKAGGAGGAGGAAGGGTAGAVGGTGNPGFSIMFNRLSGTITNP